MAHTARTRAIGRQITLANQCLHPDSGTDCGSADWKTTQKKKTPETKCALRKWNHSSVTHEEQRCFLIVLRRKSVSLSLRSLGPQPNQLKCVHTERYPPASHIRSDAMGQTPDVYRPTDRTTSCCIVCRVYRISNYKSRAKGGRLLSHMCRSRHSG